MAGNEAPPGKATKKTTRFHALLCEPPTMVVVEVGPELKRYHLHKSLLTPHSEYFRKVFEGPWKEADEKLVTLEDVDVSAWNLVISWFYTQRFPGQPRTQAKVLMDSDWEDLKCEWAEAIGDPDASWFEVCMAMLKASVLGDRFLMPDFGRTIRTMIVTTLDALNYAETKKDLLLPSRLFRYTSDHFPADHPLLQYFVCLLLKYDKDNTIYAIKKVIRNLPRDISRRKAWWASQRFYEDDLGSTCFLEHANNQEEYDCPKKFHLLYIPEFKSSMPYESKIKKTYDTGESDEE